LSQDHQRSFVNRRPAGPRDNAHATVRGHKKLVQEQGDNQSFTAAANHQEMLQAIESLRPKLAIESSTSANDIEKHLNEEIDGYRELLREDKPRTAIKLLTKLKERVWSTASARVRFRIVSNLGAANHKIGEYDAARGFPDGSRSPRHSGSRRHREQDCSNAA
jgi:hypothetical protein